VSSARRKGNALELEVATWLHALDGRDRRIAVLETAGGRLGSTYALQVDVASRRFVVECKAREDNPTRLWTWLDGLQVAAGRLAERLGGEPRKIAFLVLRRNHRRPLVVIDRADFESIVRCASVFDSRLTDWSTPDDPEL
jgi:hypothetical protein